MVNDVAMYTYVKHRLNEYEINTRRDKCLARCCVTRVTFHNIDLNIFQLQILHCVLLKFIVVFVDLQEKVIVVCRCNLWTKCFGENIVRIRGIGFQPLVCPPRLRLRVSLKSIMSLFSEL